MDNGSVDFGVLATFLPEGPFDDTAEFTLDAAEDVIVTVTGYSHVQCSGGRGANCKYDLCDVTAISVVDSLLNDVGTITVTTAKGIGNAPYSIWTCALPALEPDTYTINVTGNAHSRTKIPGSDHPAIEPYTVLVSG